MDYVIDLFQKMDVKTVDLKVEKMGRKVEREFAYNHYVAIKVFSCLYFLLPGAYFETTRRGKEHKDA